MSFRPKGEIWFFQKLYLEISRYARNDTAMRLMTRSLRGTKRRSNPLRIWTRLLRLRLGVRLQNQRSSLLKACGGQEVFGRDAFVLDCLNRQIGVYEKEKSAYEKEFVCLAKKHPAIKHQRSLPGIGHINAVKIVARVVSPFRFADKGHYWSYAGLIKHEKISGQRSYGKRSPRYCRQLKNVYKTGVNAAIGGNNPINDYYEYLIEERGEAAHKARNKACRRLATLSLGVFKSGKKYQPYRSDHIST